LRPLLAIRLAWRNSDISPACRHATTGFCGAYRAQPSHEPEPPIARMIGGNAARQFAIPPIEKQLLTA
jgi:hypothetical protein